LKAQTVAIAVAGRCVRCRILGVGLWGRRANTEVCRTDLDLSNTEYTVHFFYMIIYFSRLL
jgi:hypothetical protein